MATGKLHAGVTLPWTSNLIIILKVKFNTVSLPLPRCPSRTSKGLKSIFVKVTLTLESVALSLKLMGCVRHS